MYIFNHSVMSNIYCIALNFGKVNIGGLGIYTERINQADQASKFHAAP